MSTLESKMTVTIVIPEEARRMYDEYFKKHKVIKRGRWIGEAIVEKLEREGRAS